MVLAGTTHGLYRTSDAGETWQGVEDETVGQETIAYVEFSPRFSQDNTIFVAVRGIGLFRSTDAGRSWEAVAPYLINRGIQFSKFRLSPQFRHRRYYLWDNTGDDIPFSQWGTKLARCLACASANEYYGW